MSEPLVCLPDYLKKGGLVRLDCLLDGVCLWKNSDTPMSETKLMLFATAAKMEIGQYRVKGIYPICCNNHPSRRSSASSRLGHFNTNLGKVIDRVLKYPHRTRGYTLQFGHQKGENLSTMFHGYRLPKKRSSSAGTQVLKAPTVPLDESFTIQCDGSHKQMLLPEEPTKLQQTNKLLRHTDIYRRWLWQEVKEKCMTLVWMPTGSHI
ncbi:hypothetical protein V8E54_001196 [Elaphomyces granulatus]